MTLGRRRFKNISRNDFCMILKAPGTDFFFNLSMKYKFGQFTELFYIPF